MNENALKERLKAIAKERGVQVNAIWKQLLLERFLARLTHSAHHDHLIFKGGLLLSQRLQIGRETVDIDFLARRLKAEAQTIETAIREVASVDTSDGFTFSFAGIEELAQPHMNYPGFRVTLDANMGTMRDKIQIDIGVGDRVSPIAESFRPFEYRGKPIFTGEITLLTYPVEAIFAEKLETLLAKGAINSRMKDYHDLILMIREKGFLDFEKLKTSLIETFAHRGTDLALPITFDEQGLQSLQRLWSNHLRGLGAFREKLGLPADIRELISELNSWLAKNGSID